jgi:predicted SAM-dependent methyltransferase
MGREGSKGMRAETADTPRGHPSGTGGLNIGCGSNVVEGWVNCDRLFGTLAFRLGRAIGWPRYRKCRGVKCLGLDARRRLPFTDGSVDAIYEQHMLYAFELADTQHFFRECYRVLRTGGILRVNEDDLRTIASSYLEGTQQLIGHVNRSSFVRAVGIVYPADALSALFKRWRSLRWFYDAQSLAGHLAEAGFHPVEAAGFRQSRIADIAILEKDNRENPLGQVWLEAIKP